MDLVHRISDQEAYGLSHDLWRNFPVWEILAHHDRSVGIGFFDDFEAYCPTTLLGGYVLLATSGSIAQVADVANAFGTIAMITNGSAEDELVMARGCGLSAPYKLTARDLCFEARLKVSIITAAKYGLFVGLSEIACATTDHLFVDTTGAMADYNHCGFCKLVAEGGAIDGAYKADGQTFQNGATITKLDSLHTFVADTYVKLGFRYDASREIIRYYVNGVEKTALTSAQKLAATFPDDVFLTPVIGSKDTAGDAAYTITVDWLACAQEV